MSNESADEFLVRVRQVCDESLKAPPGTAVKVPPEVTEQMRRFLRGEPSVMDDLLKLSKEE